MVDALPIFADRSFTCSCRLWNEVKQLSEATAIAKVCRNYSDIPQYLLRWLEDNKNVSKAAIYLTRVEVEAVRHTRMTFEAKMKEFWSVEGSLAEKELMLDEA